ncbi:Sec-independent protein translocase protein TatB [Gilvimarinus algae]|uniref:Sec-independent protein translocase protein TatB n=1 Tax=Gilvimarinus algae TaxID=3058037 RepID=A0ABT8T9T9_9GAMM|nr:Sec-independent protein translocase protein TatB [Gilvimarinus sp. SDUM040014]MDO3380867.1 Sec-independent protein translocase protein TatB [Gilvimarinus sp. SDUM040014]
MFDIGFFELLLIAIVSLVIIGPERLPETVRAVSLWIGRLKRSLRETRSEIEKQIGADDIRRQLHNEEIMRNLEATRRDIEGAMEPERAKRMHDHYQGPEEAPDHAHQEHSSRSDEPPKS